MIKRALCVQFNPWGEVYHYEARDVEVKVGDNVVVKTETGFELGKVIGTKEVDEAAVANRLVPIVRRATPDDLVKSKAANEKKDQALEKARRIVTKHKLEMKLVDCVFSFDGGKVTFVFTAEGRVDFRELVKELARTFQKSIRLQQIGIRDEAKRFGGVGPCGRELCCRKFMHELSSVPTDLARIQQVHSRGSDRISGACGRLMCCLAYEADFYESAMKKFPPLESMVKTKHGSGKVVSCNVIKKTVTVDIDGNYTEVLLQEIKKV